MQAGEPAVGIRLRVNLDLDSCSPQLGCHSVEIPNSKVHHPDLVDIPEIVARLRERGEGGGSCLLLPSGFLVARWCERDPQVLLVPTPQRCRIVSSEEQSSDSRHPVGQNYHRSRNAPYFLRRVATSSRATSRARGRSPGSNEIADTLGWPPPPNFSASDAKFLSAVAWFHGFVPNETLARTADALTLTEYTLSGCSRYGMNLLYPSRSRSPTSKKITPSRDSLRSRKISIDFRCRSSSGSRCLATSGSFTISPRGR